MLKCYLRSQSLKNIVLPLVWYYCSSGFYTAKSSRSVYRIQGRVGMWKMGRVGFGHGISWSRVTLSSSRQLVHSHGFLYCSYSTFGFRSNYIQFLKISRVFSVGRRSETVIVFTATSSKYVDSKLWSTKVQVWYSSMVQAFLKSRLSCDEDGSPIPECLVLQQLRS